MASGWFKNFSPPFTAANPQGNRLRKRERKGDFTANTEGRQKGPASRSPYPRPFPEKAVPQDEKRLGCVKKARCLSAASLGPLAGQSLFKAFAGLGPRLFRFLFGQCKKEQTVLACVKSSHCSATGKVLYFCQNVAKVTKKLCPYAPGDSEEQRLPKPSETRFAQTQTVFNGSRRSSGLRPVSLPQRSTGIRGPEYENWKKCHGHSCLLL